MNGSPHKVSLCRSPPHPHLVTCPSTLTPSPPTERVYSPLLITPRPQTKQQPPSDPHSAARPTGEAEAKGSSRSRALSPPLLLPSRRPELVLVVQKGARGEQVAAGEVSRASTCCCCCCRRACQGAGDGAASMGLGSFFVAVLTFVVRIVSSSSSSTKQKKRLSLSIFSHTHTHTPGAPPPPLRPNPSRAGAASAPPRPWRWWRERTKREKRGRRREEEEKKRKRATGRRDSKKVKCAAAGLERNRHDMKKENNSYSLQILHRAAAPRDSSSPPPPSSVTGGSLLGAAAPEILRSGAASPPPRAPPGGRANASPASSAADGAAEVARDTRASVSPTEDPADARLRTTPASASSLASPAAKNSSISLAEGRFCGSSSRQRSMQSRTSAGASSGTSSGAAARSPRRRLAPHSSDRHPTPREHLSVASWRRADPAAARGRGPRKSAGEEVAAVAATEVPLPASNSAAADPDALPQPPPPCSTRASPYVRDAASAEIPSPRETFVTRRRGQTRPRPCR